MIPIMRLRGMAPFTLMPPQTMTDPPPCFTVGMTQCFSNLSPSRLLTNTRRFVPNNSNLLSSVKTTFAHCSFVQLTWFFAKSSRFLTFCFRNNGFFAATRPFKPHFNKTLLIEEWDTRFFLLSWNSFVISGKLFVRNLVEINLIYRLSDWEITSYLPRPGA